MFLPRVWRRLFNFGCHSPVLDIARRHNSLPEAATPKKRPGLPTLVAGVGCASGRDISDAPEVSHEITNAGPLRRSPALENLPDS